MDKSTLTKLKRTALQQLAKREGVRANAKSADIIDLLLQKFPHGAPSLQLRVNEQQKRRNLGKETKRRRLNIPTPDVVAAAEHRKYRNRSILSSPSRVSRSESVAGGDEMPERLRHSSPRIPRNKAVRCVKRDITRLIDERVVIWETVDETELLVAHAMSSANEISKDIREISWTRYCVEMDVVHQLKHDRTLWDGTRLKSDEDERQQRESLLKNANRREGAEPES